MRTKQEISAELETLKQMRISPSKGVGFVIRRLWALMALRWVLEEGYSSPSQRLQNLLPDDLEVK